MYPREIPASIRAEPTRSSEVAVYERIRDQLSADYRCYYSRSWHEVDRDGTQEFDGEADFIIAHSDLGLLFLEVKGGRVSCRASDGQWISRDRHDIPYEIKNPIGQARSSKHHFLRRLKKTNQLRHRHITVRHAAILPGSSRPQSALAADAPLDLIAFGDDMNRLGDWIRSRMQEGDMNSEPFGQDGIQAVEDMLSSHFELRAHIGVSLAEDSQKIDALTAEQAWILDSLEDNPQQAISGGAGTGKTVLAVEKAIRSADEGKRTLLICYNAPLAAYLQTLTCDYRNLVACSLHKLCLDVAADVGLSGPDTDNGKGYKDPAVNLLLEAIEKRPELRFDAIIVDEGQDFRDMWLDTLKLCLSDIEKGGFYVFYDDNQSLYETEASFIASLPSSQYRLTRNLRNTRNIHAAMKTWYKGRSIHAAGPEGQPVERIEIRHPDMAISTVNERISHLIRSGQLEAGDIAVISGATVDPRTRPERIGGASVTTATEVRKGAIVFDTVRRYKGLSKPCVFIVHPEGLDKPDLRYVALSRANLLLGIVGTRSAIAALLNEEHQT